MKSSTAIAGAGILILLGSVILLSLDDGVDRGREVYAMQKCALCHSISGIGGKKMPLDRIGSKMKPDDIKKWVRTPKAMKADTTMKAYPNLPEKDLDDLTLFLTTLR